MRITKILLLLGLFSVSSWGQTGNTEFRSTWVITWEHIHSSWTAEQNKTRVREILDNHKAANMNAVLWQARQSGTAYYNSSYEPWGYYAGSSDPGYDPLAYAIEEAHKRGIEVHAWFNVFSAASTAAGTPAAEHPDWVCRDQSGIPMSESRALSPGLAAVRDYTLNVAMEIVNNYDIDGIHLDYIRWNEYSNSSRSNLTQIEQESQLDGMISEQQIEALDNSRTGRYLYDVDHPYNSGVPAGYGSWEEWWRSSVTTFVEMLHDSIQAVKPHVRLSVAALGKYNWSGWQGYGSVYQDAAKWFNDGSIEQLTPMSYHWLDATSFYNMLEGDCPECWGQWIQPGVSAGRLFSAGPGSYRLSENNIWGRHPSIVEISRTVPWLDGFQFFSYGSWDYHDYWEEAGGSFFSKQTKIRETTHASSVQPNAPAISLNKIDSLQYEITVTPADTTENAWFAVYRSPNDSMDVNQSTIVTINFGKTEFLVNQVFDGLQDFNGEYTYSASALNRYWKESDLSNLVTTDSIPSLPPLVANSNPSEGDTVSVRPVVMIEFSKSMAVTSVESGLTITPPADFNINWSENDHNLGISFTNNLPYATVYTIKIDSTASDVNGTGLDGNGDGIIGDSFILSFMTNEVDIFGPEVYDFNLDFVNITSGFDVDEVVSLTFNEIIDEATIDQGIELSLLGNPLTLDYNHFILNEMSIVSIRPANGYYSDAPYLFSLTSDLMDSSGNSTAAQTAEFQTEALRYDEVIMIDNFAFLSNWKDPGYSGSTKGILAGTDFTTSSQVYVPGTGPYKSARLRYVWDPDWDTNVAPHMIREYLAEGPPRAVEFDTSYTLQVYIFGDGSNNQFRFALDEAVGTSWPNHEVSQWITIDWYGWRLVKWDLSNPSQVGDWIGNEILDGTRYRIDSFQLTWDTANGAASGAIYFDELRIIKKTSDLATDKDSPAVPGSYVLHQNFPNPFNPTTTIPFSVPVQGLVTIDIYDIMGHHIYNLVDGEYSPGYHVINWNGVNSAGRKIASGTYIYRLIAGDNIQHRKMLYIK